MTKKWITHLLLCTLLLLISSCSHESESDTYTPIDYQASSNWFKLGTGTNYGVDVFYLYPTSWTPSNSDGMYCGIDNVSMRNSVPGIYAKQAALFEGFTNIYAPWYRQANAVETLSLTLEQQDQVLQEIPYRDALNAFEYYLAHFNKGKPFILAGHSQGANLIKFLLQEYMAEHPEVLNRMVVAYPLGYSFEKKYFEQNRHLRFAESETDTRVVVSWNCERQENGKLGTTNLVCHPGALAINPVSWKHDYIKTEADDPRNLGSRVIGNQKYSVQVVYDPARDYEVLMIGINDNSMDSPIIGDLSLHGYDYALFFENIIENAKKRIAAFH